MIVKTSEIDPGALMTRKLVAAELTRLGLPTTAMSLANFAYRGEGPPMARWGGSVIYVWRDVLTWAEKRLEASSSRARTSKDQIAA